MQPVSLVATRYDTRTIVFHWATAILVATQWLGAQIIDWFPKGTLRVDARSMHIVCGLLLAVILLSRIAWRLTRGRRLPLADGPVLNFIAKTTHWGLYTLVTAMVVVGIALAWTRGDSIFNLFTLPAFDPSNRALADQVQEVHATIGWVIVVVVGLHAAAALFHRLVWHDGILGRMLPAGFCQRSRQPARSAETGAV
jgi:cytochrome b561